MIRQSTGEKVAMRMSTEGLLDSATRFEETVMNLLRNGNEEEAEIAETMLAVVQEELEIRELYGSWSNQFLVENIQIVENEIDRYELELSYNESIDELIAAKTTTQMRMFKEAERRGMYRQCEYCGQELRLGSTQWAKGRHLDMC